MLYTIILSLHDLNRWLVILFAGLALYRAYTGWLRKKEWSKMDGRAGMLFTGVLDLQLLLGLILYFFASPITRVALTNFSAAMSNPQVRFFSVEHVFTMVVAVAVAHVGSALSRRATEPQGKFKRAALWFSLSILLILIAIPWPFAPVARPWLRLGGLTL